MFAFLAWCLIVFCLAITAYMLYRSVKYGYVTLVNAGIAACEIGSLFVFDSPYIILAVSIACLIAFVGVYPDYPSEIPTTSEIPTNILILGKTGVGKSSLLNYLYGKEIAQTGSGRPVTGQGIYNLGNFTYNDMRITVYDSWGIEPDKAEERNAQNIVFV